MTTCPFTGVAIEFGCDDCTIRNLAYYQPTGCPILSKYLEVMEEGFELHTEEIVRLLGEAQKT